MNKTLHACLAPTLAIGPLATAAAHGLHAAEAPGAGGAFLHSFVGLDHLLAMLLLGLWAARAQRPANALAPVAFLGGVALGVAAGRAGVALPGVEALIAASVLALGCAVACRLRLPTALALALAAAFGLCHGNAHGIELGADAGLAAALAFLAGSATLHALGFAGARLARRPRARAAVRLTGVAAALAGLRWLVAA